MDYADSTPTIPEFYAGRDVLVTGATGFMGKVLVERLLSTCPEVGRLFLLVRTKRNLAPPQRLEQLKKCPVFDVLRQTNPQQLDKLRAVAADITQPSLGISDADAADLAEVSVVFNCAATVRIGAPLRCAVTHNTLSVARLLDLADRFNNVAAFVHVSTGFCVTEPALVPELVPPPPRALRRLLDRALAVPDDADPRHVNKIISPKPNTYTYSKALAESVLQQHWPARFPRALYRPSIVISSLRHPFPGWIEGYSGAGGVVMGVQRGVLHVMHCRAAAGADLLPVDVAIDSIIAIGWDIATNRPQGVRVYNGSSGENPTTWGAMGAAATAASRREPCLDVVWYPFNYCVENRVIHDILMFLLLTAPLFAVECAMRIFTRKKKRTNYIRLARILHVMNVTVHYFATREWRFATDNTRRLRARMHLSDCQTYNLDVNTIDWEEYYVTFVRGCRRHARGFSDDTLPAARARLAKLYLAHLGVQVLLPLLIIGVVLATTVHSWIRLF